MKLNMQPIEDMDPFERALGLSDEKIIEIKNAIIDIVDISNTRTEAISMLLTETDSPEEMAIKMYHLGRYFGMMENGGVVVL